MAYHTPPSPRLLMPCNAKLLAIAQSRHACAFTVVLSLCNVHVMVNIDVVANGPPLACTVKGGGNCGDRGLRGQRRIAAPCPTICYSPHSCFPLLLWTDAKWRRRRLQTCATGECDLCGRAHNLWREAEDCKLLRRYSDHADAGYKPALPERDVITGADGHTAVCGEW